MQSRDCVERRQNRALLPGWNVGGVLTGENDTPVDGAQVLVMLPARFLGPPAKAAEDPWNPVPSNRYAVFVIGPVLRVDPRTTLDRLLQAVLRWQCSELVSIVEHVGAEQHALA